MPGFTNPPTVPQIVREVCGMMLVVINYECLEDPSYN